MKGDDHMGTMMTSKQKKQILRVIADELDKNPLSKNATQEMLAQGRKLQEGVRNLFAGIINSVLTLISGNVTILIEAVDGGETIPNTKGIFDWIDSDFKHYGADEAGSARKETLVAVYEMAQDATFAQMFGSFGENLNRLCLTQAQIITFVKEHRDWLRTDGYGTFFLFKSKNNFFVASVCVYSDGGLDVRVYRFEDSVVWGAGRRRRLVVPQLA